MNIQAWVSVLLVSGLILGPAQSADVRVIQPFTAIGLCVPFNVRLEHPPNGQDYKVTIDADPSVISAVKTTWPPALDSFSQLPAHGALSISANSSFFKSTAPVQLTIQIPPKKLEAIDVTEGTQVSFSKGFQIADEGGIWYIPAGALLLAPSITVKGPLTLETEGSSNDTTFKRGGRIVWTNGDAANTALQAMSLEGPVTAVINSSTAELGNQSFSLEPSISADYANLKSSYANVTVAVDYGALGVLSQASLRDTYFPQLPCKAKCPIRVITCSYGQDCSYPNATANANPADFIPPNENPVPWTTCPQSISNFACYSDTTNQTCAVIS